MYSDKVIELFKNPKNVGVLENANAYFKMSPECGDIAEITMYIEEDIIKDINFRSYGCAAAIASSSMATELVKGQHIEQALNLQNKVIVEKLGGLPDEKVHCSVMAGDAIKGAIREYKSKNQ